MNKKGVSKGFIWLIVAIAILFAILVVAFYPDVKEKLKPTAPVWLDSKEPNINWDGPIGWVLTYFFGVSEDKAESISALVVLIAVWVIFFLAFADMIDKFGFFDKTVAWIIGLAMAVILANINLYYNLLINLMGLFSFLAAFSVIGALLSIFVSMFAVHWGISSFAPRLMRRKAMMEGAKAEAGGRELAGKIKGLKQAGEALKK